MSTFFQKYADHPALTPLQAGIKQQESVKKLWQWVVLPLVVFTIATTVLTYPMILHLEDSVLDKADPLLNAWILSWDAHSLITDPSNLYHANDFYPYSNTLAYSEALLGQALLAAPVIWLTNNSILAVNICWFLTFILSGLTMYILVYELTCSKSAALAAGMIFAFNSFRFAHIVHLQLLSAQWIPLCLFFLIRLMRRPSWQYGVGLWFSFNLQALSCYYYALFTAFALATFLTLYLFIYRPSITYRLMLQMFLLILATAVIQIPLSIPYFKVAAAMDFERTLEDAITGGADLTDFLTAPPTNRFFGQLTESLRGKGWWEHITFPGIATLALAVAAVINRNSWKDRKILAAFGLFTLISFLFSLGPALQWNEHLLLTPLPYRLLFEFVPGFRAIRQPARLHIVTMAGISVIAGIGLQQFLERIISIKWRTSLVVLTLSFISLENWGSPLEVFRMPLADEIPPVYQWLNTQPGDGPILELPILSDVGSVEAPRLYYSTFHWKRLINGYGGFFPPAYAYFLFFDREFPTQPYDWLLGLGTRYVILHRWQYTPAELKSIDTTMTTFGDRLRLVAEFDQDQVYEVLQPITGQPNSSLLSLSIGGQSRLLGYVIKPPTASADTLIKVKLFWQCLTSMEKDYTVFIHVVDEKGNLVAQSDGQPDNGNKPTSSWLPDEVVLDSHTILLPKDIKNNTFYVIHVGMYDLQTMQRLPIQEFGGIMLRDFLELGPLKLDTTD